MPARFITILYKVLYIFLAKKYYKIWWKFSGLALKNYIKLIMVYRNPMSLDLRFAIRGNVMSVRGACANFITLRARLTSRIARTLLSGFTTFITRRALHLSYLSRDYMYIRVRGFRELVVTLGAST